MFSQRTAAFFVSLCLASVSAVALLAIPEPAQACGKGVCPRGYFAPRDGTTVPANVPAFVHAGSQAPPAGVAAVTITTDDGATPIAFVTDGAFLKPTAPLVAGKIYAVSQYQSCGTGASVGLAAQTFLAGPAAPLPSTLGQIALVERYVAEDYAVYAGTKCKEPTRAAVARLIFEPSSDLAPWLPVTTFAFAVDGQPYGASQFGLGPNDADPHPYWQRWLLEAHGTCAEPSKESQLTRGLPLGTHTYTVEATLAGQAEPIGKIEGTFELSCEGVPSGSGTGTGTGSGTATGTGTGTGTGSGAGTGSGTATGTGTGTGSGTGTGTGTGTGSSGSGSGLDPAVSSGGEASGCAVGRATSTSWTIGLGLLFGLGSLARRGRRRNV